MIIHLHGPAGIIVIDSDTVTDEELAQLCITREVFNGLLPPPPPPAPSEQELARLHELLANPPTAITMPKIWEALHILAKFHIPPS